MPITKIGKIKNLAVFQDFDWDSALRNAENNIQMFNLINIIYGRNYSGKTTLSRIMRALELGHISDKYENPEFSVCIRDQADVTQSNLTAHGKIVRVFNEDFVKDNLKFIVNPEDSIIPFAILGGNSSLEEEITQLKSELGEMDDNSPTGFYLNLKNARELYTAAKASRDAAVKQLDNKIVQKATSREIGIKYKPEIYGDQNYNRSKLEDEINVVLENKFVPISDEEKERLLKLLQEKANPNIPSIPVPVFSFSDIISEAEDLITQPVSEAGKIEELVKNSILNRWVKEGKGLHQNKLKDCAFCGNEIQQDRWTELEKHFDDESEKLTKSIEQLIAKVEKEQEVASKALNIQNNLFYSKFHTKLDKLSGLYKKVVECYSTSLSDIKGQLEARKDDIINSKVFKQPLDYSKRLLLFYEVYNNIRDSANQYTGQLSSDQIAAKILLRLREVSDFAITIQYVEEQKNIIQLEAELSDKELAGKDVVAKIEDQKQKIQDKQRLLNDEEKGAIKVNEYLNNYFGHDFLKLEAVEEIAPESSGKSIRFEIIRNGKKAHHLSEGECSLIAFCYFMARLDDIDTKGLKPIIWIDDPISSLDGNHIFFIYSLINSEIVSKKEYEQLFISTHNLDFLKYLKRLPMTKAESNYFIVVRENNTSTINRMPKYLKDYVTEFNYLFHQIYICANANIDAENQHLVYYNFANNARKFLEAFLFYKYPNAVERDDKLLRFFGNNQQASSMTNRINNEYSHLEGIFERSMIPIDIPEMKKVASFVLEKIKEKDLDQYNCLLKSIDVVETVN